MATAARYVTFHNGYKMPIIGLGTFLAPPEVIEQSVNAALEAGYRHIDTAYTYGNEEAIGVVLKKWLDSGRIKREELFITTKLPLTGNRAENVEKYLKKSLENLQLSYVDLYLIHHAPGYEEQDKVDLNTRVIDMKTDHLGIWKAMEAQVDAGRARSIGISNFNARQIKRIVNNARIRPANLQVELHLYFQQRELVAFCRALDITVCAYAPFGSPSAAVMTRKRFDLSEDSLPSPLNEPVVLEIAKKHNKTPAQVLLRHAIQRGIVVIPKSANPTRVKDNFQVFDFRLDADEVYKLDSLDKGPSNRYFYGFKGLDVHPEYAFHDRY